MQGSSKFMDDVTPNDMPVSVPAETAEGAGEATTVAAEPESAGESDRITEKLNREAAKHRHRAKEAEQRLAAAEDRLKQVAALFGDKSSADDFDPRSAIEQMRSEFNSERKARLVSEVARTEGVEPEDIRGETEDEMRESAQTFKARLEARVNAAVEAATKARIPSVPASTVTADGKIAGPDQITSREQLKSMTSQQIVTAQKEGRMDQLLGKKN